MTDCGCTNFPASLGNVTFGASVGIGTTTPAASLDVSGSGAGVAAYVGPTSDDLGALVLRGGTANTYWELVKLRATDTPADGLYVGFVNGTTPTPVLTATTGGKVGIGTGTPADALEVAGGGLAMGGVHQQSGLLVFGATSAGHYYRLADVAITTNTGGTYDEDVLWGTVQYRRTNTAELGQLTFVLYTKQQGPTSVEPTLGFKYRFDGATAPGGVPQLVALRTSAAGATVKTFRLWLLTPANYATARFLYWYYADVDSVVTLYTAAQDDGTTAPAGTAPDYVGDTLVGVNGGNVGIGATSPQYLLDVERPTGGPMANFRRSADQPGMGLTICPYGAAAVVYASGAEFDGTTSTARALSATQFEQLNGGFTWYGDTNLTAGSPYARTPRLTLTGAGQLGVGTTAPLTPLHVAGNLLIGLGAPRLSLGRNDGSDPTTTKTWHLDNSANDLRVFQQHNVNTAGYVYLIIKDGGNVGIGTSSPQAPLDVAGQANVGSLTAGGKKLADGNGCYYA